MQKWALIIIVFVISLIAGWYGEQAVERFFIYDEIANIQNF